MQSDLTEKIATNGQSLLKKFALDCWFTKMDDLHEPLDLIKAIELAN